MLGVSPDAPARNLKFKEKHDFPFRLLSDTERALTKAYGAWVKKKLYGRESMGLERTTVLVDADGVVRELWRAVKVQDHVDAVLAAAKELA